MVSHLITVYLIKILLLVTINKSATNTLLLPVT
jgi:hypothetical protein